MELTVLAVPDCPHVALLLRRLEHVLLGAPARPQVFVLVITSEAEAADLGVHGSPTLLVDGDDPFATPGAAVSVSCRIYRGADGRVDGAPSVEQLREALDGGR